MPWRLYPCSLFHGPALSFVVAGPRGPPPQRCPRLPGHGLQPLQHRGRRAAGGGRLRRPQPQGLHLHGRRAVRAMRVHIKQGPQSQVCKSFENELGTTLPMKYFDPLGMAKDSCAALR